MGLTAEQHRRWLLVPAPRPAPTLRAFCLPHAGGDAPAFAALARAVPNTVEIAAVRLPARAGRLNDPPADTFDQLVGEVYEIVSGCTEVPYVVLGQSFGAIVAFELACRLARSGRPPVACTVAAITPPDSGWGGQPMPQDVADLEGHLRQVHGGEDGLPEHAELRELALTTLASDMRVFASYPAVFQRFPGALHAVCGADDPGCTVTGLALWSRWTSGRFSVAEVPGGHLIGGNPTVVSSPQGWRDLFSPVTLHLVDGPVSPTATIGVDSDVDTLLSEIWWDLTGGGQPVAEDDFFLVGGHSMLVPQLVAMIEDRFAVRLAVRDIFARSCFGDVSEMIRASRAGGVA